MLALFFDDDGDIGPNLTGGRFCRKMKIRGSRDHQLHAARNRFQFPVTISAGIALHGNAPRGGMRLYVARSTINVDVAAGGICFDAPSWFGDPNDSGDGPWN